MNTFIGGFQQVKWDSYLQLGEVLFISQRDDNTCSHHVKLSCYFDVFTGYYALSNDM